jgi:hypothetical protein
MPMIIYFSKNTKRSIQIDQLVKQFLVLYYPSIIGLYQSFQLFFLML